MQLFPSEKRESTTPSTRMADFGAPGRYPFDAATRNSRVGGNARAA
jgi:hypothetical protein